MHTCIYFRAEIHVQDDYGISPCDLAETEEMMRAVGMFNSVVMLENTALFVLKVLYVCILMIVHVYVYISGCAEPFEYSTWLSCLRILLVWSSRFHIYIYAYMYVCIHVYLYVCACVYVNSYTYIYYACML